MARLVADLQKRMERTEVRTCAKSVLKTKALLLMQLEIHRFIMFVKNLEMDFREEDAVR